MDDEDRKHRHEPAEAVILLHAPPVRLVPGDEDQEPRAERERGQERPGTAALRFFHHGNIER